MKYTLLSACILLLFLAGCQPSQPVTTTIPAGDPSAPAFFPSSSTPASPQIQPSATGITASPSTQPISSFTPTVEPTAAPLPTLTSILLANDPPEALVDNLLDWKPVLRPERFTGQFAFDGTWLVTGTMTDVGKWDPLMNLLAHKLNATEREIFAFPESKTVANYEWGSGMELVAGRLAFVVSPQMGDTTFGYEVWLIDQESGEKTQVKVSDRALPGIALSERWLAVLDSTTEQSFTGERCMEVYALPSLTRQQVFCTEDGIRWPELSGDWLTYKRYLAESDSVSNFPTIETLNLVTGETYSTSTNSRAISLKIYTSESLIAWQEDGRIVVWPRPDDPQKIPDKVRFGSNWTALQVCGERVYYTADHQGAMELRSWQRDGTVRVLHRYRGLTQFDPQYKDLPQYDFVEIQCGRDWVMFQTSKADIFVAKEGK